MFFDAGTCAQRRERYAFCGWRKHNGTGCGRAHGARYQSEQPPGQDGATGGNKKHCLSRHGTSSACVTTQMQGPVTGTSPCALFSFPETVPVITVPPSPTTAGSPPGSWRPQKPIRPVTAPALHRPAGLLCGTHGVTLLSLWCDSIIHVRERDVKHFSETSQRSVAVCFWIVVRYQGVLSVPSCQKTHSAVFPARWTMP